jgi:hypothetical protein
LSAGAWVLVQRCSCCVERTPGGHTTPQQRKAGPIKPRSLLLG